MTARRTFLKSLLAASVIPTLSWADAGSPSYLAAAKIADGRFSLFGLDAMGQIRFSIPLPTRGHAAAAHPTRPEAVAFARRPGTYAIVLDCISGDEIARMTTPEGRHFYGHGVFSQDGNTLFTTENHIETGEGRIGVWQVSAEYRRVGEFSSNGVGPHEILRLTGSDILVVANGGIRTHPETGRAKLNLETMRPNLSYLTTAGAVLDVVELDETLHQNSIRHIALGPDGLVGMAMQWQGNVVEKPPLLALHQMGETLRLLAAPMMQHRWLKGYAGSIAFSNDGQLVGITSPRGGVAQFFDTTSDGFIQQIDQPDICGLAPHLNGFLATDGSGNTLEISVGGATLLTTNANMAWDNHLVPIKT
ncbi:MAG: DUF1513 domain-containing protein [Rhodobacteraceae bacterium]|nr:DUF1513 domain-containing protein [Paracoccaceae bacterium]